MGNISSQTGLSDLLNPGILLISAVTLYAVRVILRAIEVRGDLARIGNLPGPRLMYGPNTILGRLLPSSPYLARSGGWTFRHNHHLHRWYGSDIVSFSYLFNSSSIHLLVADASAVKKITANRLEFPKPLAMYKPLSIFGANIVATEFDEWKRHRRVAAPSFGEKNNQMVYEETTRIMGDLFQIWSGSGDGEPVRVDNAVDLTSKVSLMVISAAGFGSRMGWLDGKEPPNGYAMTFEKALDVVVNNVITRLLFGNRVLRLRRKGRDVITAFEELRVHMNEMIKERRQNPTEDGRKRADLFTNLINGTTVHQDAEAEHCLSDEELMGNVFIFLFAGHETTANSLGFTLALLATNRDIQEKCFSDLRKIVPCGQVPSYSQIVKWSYGLAVVYESLRMYPPVINFPKYAATDTVLSTTSTDESNTPIAVPVPRGTKVVINVSGLHYNRQYICGRKYWEEPDRFIPERFLGNYNRDAFMPFSGGPRSCIGRRFSEIEAVTFLANLILKYNIEATPIDRVETAEEMRKRLLRWRMGSITLRPVKVPLTFTPRQG